MTEREDNIQDMFIATAQFDTENAADYADLADAVANFLIVRSVISALEGFTADQLSGIAGQAVEQKSVLRLAVRRKLVRYARTARGLNINDPGFRRLFNVPDENNDQTLLAAARVFVEEARRFEADFARRGIPKELADQLEADINAMEAAMSAKASGQMETVGATAGIDAEIERGMNAEKILDSMMRNVYDDNPVKLAAWRTARHVRRLKQKPQPPTT